MRKSFLDPDNEDVVFRHMWLVRVDLELPLKNSKCIFVVVMEVVFPLNRFPFFYV